MRFRLLVRCLGTIALAVPVTLQAQSSVEPISPFDQARAMLGRGDSEGATAFLLRSVSTHPPDARSHNILGALLNQQGRYNEALFHARRAVELAPADLRYRYNRGVVLAERGLFGEAVADFDAALAGLGDQAPMLLERGAALLSLGRADEARRDWARARKADPTLPWTDWYEGLHLLLDGNHDLAIAALRRVAASNPDFDSAQAWLRVAYLLAGRDYRARPVTDVWVKHLLDYQAGALPFARLMDFARRDSVTGDSRRQGEAWLHHGLRLRTSDRAAARKAFSKAVAAPAPRHMWKLLAEEQLRRMPK